jgi:predicted XRE-type DNA-binding protein
MAAKTWSGDAIEAHPARVGDDIYRGSGNFLVDQGIVDPDEFRVKAHLCHEIGAAIERKQLAQEQTAIITGLAQSDVARIVNGRLTDYSVWRLLKILTSLGADVLIAVNPPYSDEPGVIMACTAEPPDERHAATSNEVS